MKRKQGVERALITGGAGFIGSHLAERLLEDGYEVTIIDDLSTGSMQNIEHLRVHHRFSFAIETILNLTVMDRLISECDIVFHFAAAVGVRLIVENPVGTIETNVLGTEIVLKIANRYRKKVILPSTSEIYGKGNSIPFSEESDRVLGSMTKSRWSYSSSKAVDEFLTLAYHSMYKLPVVIIRLFNTIGPRQTGSYGMVVPRFIKQALRGEPITVYADGKQSRCFADVKDVVDAIVKLANCPEANGQIFNVGKDEEITIENLARKIKHKIESSSEICYISYEKAYVLGFEDMRRRVPDLTKIRKFIDYKPQISLDQSLMDIIKDMRKNMANGRDKK
ncbi:MAG: NAD-dependent epimerase/dehydratase [Candidatus Scalindua rubra]|uniref:UDP-glucuronate decarboxylase n=1 Tax=Candidatus Scalindua rubra TaxID=1872076 RepID=A0A1E3XG40_9BACT|nr:MAG: NAD-dependent epimerase/dehydratase [Candidatus Scalindua rubra]